MIEDYKLVVLGEPQALKRHRTYTRGRGGKPLPFPIQVDPSKNDKADFVAAIQRNAPPAPIDSPIAITVKFYFGRPKSHYRTGKYAGELKPNAPTWHIKRPDIDNLLKFIADSLNGVFWRDDTLVCQVLEMSKQYSKIPRTEIYIRILTERKG